MKDTRSILGRQPSRTGSLFDEKNIVFTTASFTIRDTAENIDKFLSNPNIIIHRIREDCRKDVSVYAEDVFPTIRDRIYQYIVDCTVIKLENLGVITDIKNTDFKISYNNFLNFLEDEPLWDKRKAI